jgi:hypothetical protein
MELMERQGYQVGTLSALYDHLIAEPPYSV